MRNSTLLLIKAQTFMEALMFSLLHKLKIIVLCSAVSLWVSLTAQEQRPSVAVLEPAGNASITTTNKMIVRGYLEQYIVNSRKYRVVDRNRTNEIMKEHSFSRGGLVDNEKAKELGKLLQADIVCVSELRREEGNFIAICSLIDVESGEVFASATEFLDSDSNMDISNGIERAAMTLMGVENAREIQAREQTNKIIEERERKLKEELERERSEQARKEQAFRDQVNRDQAERERQAREADVRRQAANEAMELARAKKESEAPTEAGIMAARATINRLMPKFDYKGNKKNGTGVFTNKTLSGYNKFLRKIVIWNIPDWVSKPHAPHTFMLEINNGELFAFSVWEPQSAYGVELQPSHITIGGKTYSVQEFQAANGVELQHLERITIDGKTFSLREFQSGLNKLILNHSKIEITVDGKTTTTLLQLKPAKGLLRTVGLEEPRITDFDILRVIAANPGKQIRIQLKGDATISFQLHESIQIAVAQTMDMYDAVNYLVRAGVGIR
jgi:flagellar biosynthesis GTPase FlhF